MIHKPVFKSVTMAVVRADAFLLLLLLPCLCCVSQSPPQVLVISFDGFRYNYMNVSITPILEGIRLEGARAEYMNNVFETKTFPNHHTIATGLYPDFHGVISNSFYDPVHKHVLHYGPEMWQYSDQILPIWIHNEDGGSERHSGVYMWPGSNFKYRNKLPTFIQEYNSSIPWTERVDTVVNWFVDPDTPANFIMMYFEEPDKTSHSFGPDSEQVKEQIRKIDSTVGYLRQSLLKNNLTNAISVIFVSDHGMAGVPQQNLINVTYLIEAHGEDCLLGGTSPVLHVIPKPSIEDDIYNSLKKLSEGNHFAVYRKAELPTEWLYKDNRRIPPIMIVADYGYAFDDIRKNGTIIYGVHGYDNKFKDMHPFFLAYGPRIKKNYTIDPFNTVDLFSLFCDVLDLKMEATNGTFDHVQEMLVKYVCEGFACNEHDTETSFPVFAVSTVVTVLATLSLLLMACFAVMLIKHLYTQYLFRRYESSSGFNVSKEFENIHLLDSDDME